MKSPKYLINTKSFITNLIKEGRLDEANRILKSDSLEQLENLSSESFTYFGHKDTSGTVIK